MVADLRFEPPIATASALPGRWVTVYTGDMGYAPPEREARAHDVARALYERRRRRPWGGPLGRRKPCKKPCNSVRNKAEKGLQGTAWSMSRGMM